jgi:hypothetical protein
MTVLAAGEMQLAIHFVQTFTGAYASDQTSNSPLCRKLGNGRG